MEKIIDEPILSEAEMEILDGSTATIPNTAELFRQFYRYSDDKISVYHSTTHYAYINLIDQMGRDYDEPGHPAHTVDLIFVTSPSEVEWLYAKDFHIELDITPIAKDGFVFITHKDNPIGSLTVEQIRDIYTGKITNWE